MPALPAKTSKLYKVGRHVGFGFSKDLGLASPPWEVLSSKLIRPTLKIHPLRKQGAPASGSALDQKQQVITVNADVRRVTDAVSESTEAFSGLDSLVDSGAFHSGEADVILRICCCGIVLQLKRRQRLQVLAVVPLFCCECEVRE